MERGSERGAGRGFLAGRFKTEAEIPEDDWRRHHPRFQGENFKRNLHLAEAVRQMAEEVGCTSAQLALAWLLRLPELSCVITGASRASQVFENLKAAEVKKQLTPDVLQRIEVILGNNPKP